MSCTRSVVCYSLTSLHSKPCQRSQTFFFNPICHLENSKQKDGSDFSSNRGLQNLSISPRARTNKRSKTKDLVAYSSVPGAPLPSGPPPSSLNGWILGLVITLILPFLGNKWGPLLNLKKGVETAVETAEHIVDAVAEVAEEVEKVAEDIADDLPEGGKLRNAVDFLENVAKETAKDAQLAEEVIDKVEEVEEKVESFTEAVEAAIDQSNANETSDQKEVEKEAESFTEAVEAAIDQSHANATPKEASDQKRTN